VASKASHPSPHGMDRPLPLSGTLVVSLEQAIAAPYATRQLADLGARVIKVERPEGGDFGRDYDRTVRGLSSHFVWANRSKESLVLDLKTAAGGTALRQLAARADVLVSNLRPGAVDRLGLDFAELRRKYPRLITCTISGFGGAGPYRDRRAYDLLVQCEAGLLAVTGTEANPAKVGISVSDIAAASHAFAGILAALYGRERSGTGTHVEISMLDSSVEWMGFPLYYTEYSGAPPPRSGSRHATIAPYGPFRVGDGSIVFLAVQNHREWQRFCNTVLELPGLARDPRFASNSDRAANWEELQEVIESGFAGLDGGAVEARLVAANIATARQRTVAEVLDHPQLRARERWTEVQSPVGALRSLLSPIGIEGTRPRMDRVPALGEHTEAILAELEQDWPPTGEGD